MQRSALLARLLGGQLRPASSRLISATPAVFQAPPPTSITNPLNQQSATAPLPSPPQPVDAIKLVSGDLTTMFQEIHSELALDLHDDTDLSEMSKYYFDGQGKAVRPVIAMCLGHAYNTHLGVAGDEEIVSKQRKVAIISEMIHTASLVHDDMIDHAESRRGKPAINVKWDLQKGAMCGDYILAVGAKILARLRNEEVVIVLSQVLADLVHGEFQQLQNKEDEAERFQLYLNKTFNKTASLIAYSCKANAILSGASPAQVEAAFQYGRNIGIAFQLVDDYLDFVSSSEMLGKPAGADLKLGLATAPVLFATSKFKELDEMIARRFSQPGDVEAAFQAVKDSDGLERTRELAKKHCDDALRSIESLAESQHKWALMSLTETVLKRTK